MDCPLDQFVHALHIDQKYIPFTILLNNWTIYAPLLIQLRLLMIKKGTRDPLYLTMACEELRMSAVFEKVGELYIFLISVGFSCLDIS